MADIEYIRGLPEVGIVPRAPHAGPLLEHLYEQEHGRGGFSGRVSHTYHLYPPMADFANPTRISDFALGLSRPDYMDAWSAYTTDPKFAYDPARLDDTRAVAERLAGARDRLAPPRPSDDA